MSGPLGRHGLRAVLALLSLGGLVAVVGLLAASAISVRLRSTLVEQALTTAGLDRRRSARRSRSPPGRRHRSPRPGCSARGRRSCAASGSTTMRPWASMGTAKVFADRARSRLRPISPWRTLSIVSWAICSYSSGVNASTHPFSRRSGRPPTRTSGESSPAAPADPWGRVGGRAARRRRLPSGSGSCLPRGVTCSVRR